MTLACILHCPREKKSAFEFLSSKPLVVLLLLLMSLHFTYTDKYILYHLNKEILPVLQLLSLPLRLNNTTKYKFLLLHAAKHTSYVAFKQWLLPFRYPLSPLFD